MDYCYNNVIRKLPPNIVMGWDTVACRCYQQMAKRDKYRYGRQQSFSVRSVPVSTVVQYDVW